MKNSFILPLFLFIGLVWVYVTNCSNTVNVDADDNGGDADGDTDGDSDGDADGDSDGDTDGDTDGDSDGDADGDSDGDADGDSDGDTDGDTDTEEPEHCGYQNEGEILEVTDDIVLCIPPYVCTPATCPASLATCENGKCVFKDEYQGLKTFKEAWATHYCNLASNACNGISYINPPKETAQAVAAKLGISVCFNKKGTDQDKCAGIVAPPPQMIGNSEKAKDPQTGEYLENWGLGTTEASGICYEITGPGGSAVVAITDRCAGYCDCKGDNNFAHCDTCINEEDTTAPLTPHCGCVGTVPGLWDECCGRGCPEVKANCDWCAANKHPHFDLDDATYNHVCGSEAPMGSCQLSAAKFIECLDPNPNWPPN